MGVCDSALPVRPRADRATGARSLPASLTSFIGRQDELTAVAKLLDSARLVTLVGPAGVGKTRL
ncbi:MAG TPA: hypothetical protein VFV02_10030, partial [Acidimicrobiales bacterium]|nr:hypothetical protein [Acidimicrobiales bacterium]